MATSDLVSDIQGQVEQSGFFKITELGQMGSKGLEAAIVIGGVLAFAWLIWGALDWLMSDGQEQKLTAAKSKITHAVIGLALLASIWTIWSLARHFLGFGSSGGSSGSSRGTVDCNTEQKAEFKRSECIARCGVKNCTGANCRTDKNEYGVKYCECAPGPGQNWVQVNNDQWGRCE